MSCFPDDVYQAIDKKVDFIFMIHQAHKASREDVVTGKECSFPPDTLRTRFFIHYFIRDSTIFLRVDTFRSSRANYMLRRYLFYYSLHHVYMPYNIVIAKKKKTSSALHASTTSPFYVDCTIKTGKDRVKALRKLT